MLCLTTVHALYLVKRVITHIGMTQHQEVISAFCAHINTVERQQEVCGAVRVTRWMKLDPIGKVECMSVFVFRGSVKHNKQPVFDIM